MNTNLQALDDIIKALETALSELEESENALKTTREKSADWTDGKGEQFRTKLDEVAETTKYLPGELQNIKAYTEKLKSFVENYLAVKF